MGRGTRYDQDADQVQIVVGYRVDPTPRGFRREPEPTAVVWGLPLKVVRIAQPTAVHVNGDGGRETTCDFATKCVGVTHETPRDVQCWRRPFQRPSKTTVGIASAVVLFPGSRRDRVGNPQHGAKVAGRHDPAAADSNHRDAVT